MNFLTKKTIFGVVVIIILIAGAVGGVYLSQRQTQLKSKAAFACSCVPSADYGDPTNKGQWCGCAAQCNDIGSLTNGQCPQAPQAATCQSDCSKCAIGSDKCGNSTYDRCDYSTCTSPGATYTCKASGNSNCQGTYSCGSACAVTTAGECTPGTQDYVNCRSCGSENGKGKWTVDYGPKSGTNWCACAIKNSGAQYAQANGCNINNGQGGTTVCNKDDYGDPAKIGKEAWCACAKNFAGDYATSPTYGGCAGNSARVSTLLAGQSADTKDGASCAYETYDDALKPKPAITSGKSYRVKVTMTNTGENVWNKDTYKLTTRDMSVWGIKDSYGLTDPERKIKSDVNPKDQAIFEIQLTAPKVTRHETFPMYFLMNNAEGKWFGAACEPKEVQVQPEGAPALSTACFAISEKQDEVTSVTNCADKTKVQEYSKDPTTLPYTFKDTTPGMKTIYVRFIPTVGEPKDFSKQILLSPNPVLNVASCTQSSTGEGTSVVLKGQYFGQHTQQGAGSLKVKGQNADITSWDGATNVITANVADKLEGEIPLELKIDDGRTISGKCVVGVSNVQFSVSTQCASSSSFSVKDLELRIIEATPGAKPAVSQKVDVLKGVPQNLNAKIEAGKKYQLLVKAPRTLVKKAEFIAERGTKNVGDIRLWIGDIAPKSGSDGKINALDKSEMSRQWSTTAGAGSVRIGDLNGDGAVNSHDYSCQKMGYNQEDEGKFIN